MRGVFILMQYFSDFLQISICYLYSFELPQLVEAIQMSTNSICFYKTYTGCNLKTTELLDCALIGACVVSRSNTVLFYGEIRKI